MSRATARSHRTGDLDDPFRGRALWLAGGGLPPKLVKAMSARPVPARGTATRDRNRVQAAVARRSRWAAHGEVRDTKHGRAEQSGGSRDGPDDQFQTRSTNRAILGARVARYLELRSCAHDPFTRRGSGRSGVAAGTRQSAGTCRSGATPAFTNALPSHHERALRLAIRVSGCSADEQRRHRVSWLGRAS